MKHSLVKLMDVILEEIQAHPDAPPTENGIRSFLAGKGYNKGDIEDAIKLVRPQFTVSSGTDNRRPASMRVLSDFEEYKLSRKAKSALARLDLYNLIDSYELEAILDGLSQFDGRVGLDELDYLLSWAVLNARDVEHQRTLFNVIEGNVEGTRH